MESRQFELNEVAELDDNFYRNDELINENQIEETLDQIFINDLTKFLVPLNDNKGPVKQEEFRKLSFEETTLGNSFEVNMKLECSPKKNSKKLFICSCGKVYKSKENLILHYKNIHLNIKPYKCSFCDSTFSHRNGKTYHERRFHTFVLPYTCQHNGCSKVAFASKSALNFHMKTKHSQK